MLLIDTSVWIAVFRDRSGQVRQQLETLIAAARIYYDLRRQGLSVRSPIDCCIAQAALENNLLLIHNDRDFETIAQVRSLQHLRFQA